jgi:hypothetical protein
MVWLALGALSSGLAAGEPDVAKLQAEFIKAYNSPHPKDRSDAVQKLAASRDRAALQLLCQVLQGDKAPMVRLAAFSILADWEDKDGSVAALLARAFEREAAKEDKQALLPGLGRQRFKFDILHALVKVLGPLSYPDPSLTSSNANVELAMISTRSFIEALLTTLNGLSGETFQAERDISRTVYGWWKKDALKFQKADFALRNKLKAEAGKKAGPEPGKAAGAGEKKAEGR